MPNVLNEYAGDGVTQIFNFSMTDGYLSRDYVVFKTRPNALILGYEDYDRSKVTWLTDFSVRTAEPFPVGTTFVITRATPEAALVDFQNTSRITERNLDTATRQSLHRTVETADYVERGVVSITELAEVAVAAAEESAHSTASAASLVTSAEQAAASAASSASVAEGLAADATNTADAALQLISIAVKGNVDSFNGRYGTVLPEAGDYTPPQVGFALGGALSGNPVWEEVPAWDNNTYGQNAAAQVITNRTELLKQHTELLSQRADKSVLSYPDYSALRAYTGSATGVYITASGIAGHFRHDSSDATSADNGGTLIVGVDGRRWKREPSDYDSVHLDWFEAKGDWNDATATGTDDSIPMQRAFDTGMSVYFNPLRTYRVTKEINGNGKPFKGVANVSSSLYGDTLRVVSVPSDMTNMRGEKWRIAYMAYSFDFIDFLRCKSCGFNTILHYCYFDNKPGGAQGNLHGMIKTAASAGLDLVMRTHDHVGHHMNMTLEQIVNATRDYDNVVGFYVIDEPASSMNMSVADQSALIDRIKALTVKPTFFADTLLGTGKRPWNNLFSHKYDYVLVNSYGVYYATGTPAENVAKDLGKLRIEYGCVSHMVNDARAIPCVGLFVETPVGVPVEGSTYTTDITQAAQGSEIFGQVGNGDYCAFIWDTPIVNGISNTPRFVQAAKLLGASAGTRKEYITDAILFGGPTPNSSSVPPTIHRPISELFARMPHSAWGLPSVGDSSSPKTYPVHLQTGSGAADKTPTAGVDYAGIACRNNGGMPGMGLGLPALEYISVYTTALKDQAAASDEVGVTFWSSPDGGYTKAPILGYSQANGVMTRTSARTTTGSAKDAGHLWVSMDANSGGLPEFTHVLMGAVIVSNW